MDGTPEVVSSALLGVTWQVRMANAEARAPFEAHNGWSFLFQRKLEAALDAFESKPLNGTGQARIHSELAAIYRQAALLAAHSTNAVYGEDHQDTDPGEVDYLLVSSLALTGDCAGAAKALARLKAHPGGGVDGVLETQVAQVSPWIEGGCTWPPPSGSPIPGSAEVDSENAQPGRGELPHFLFEEQTEEKRQVKATDPLTLVQLSRWHEDHAVALTSADLVAAWLAPWALPIEAAAGKQISATDDGWIFGGFYCAPEDIDFVAAARKTGVKAVADWKEKSPFAAAIAPSIEEDEVVPEKMLDQAAWFGKQLEAGMITAAGKEEGYQRGFANLGRVGVLRAAMVVADGAGQYRDAGILRLNAKDRSVGPASDPVFFMSVAAWDAGNRNALRAQDIIHSLVGQYPAVEVARYPLDAMHVRLSRNTAPATPMQ